MPFADVGPLKVDAGLSDEQVLFLSDILPTGYMGAEMCDIQPGDTVAVWGCGPVGLFAIKSAFLLGAERVIAIDRFAYRLEMARDEMRRRDAELRRGRQRQRGADRDDRRARTGRAASTRSASRRTATASEYMYDRTKQALGLESDRPIALREAIMACRNGGTVSVIGVYGGLVDKFPLGTVMNRSLTIKSGQCHVHRYMRPLLERIEKGEIDPTMVITHRMRAQRCGEGLRHLPEQGRQLREGRAHAAIAAARGEPRSGRGGRSLRVFTAGADRTSC